MKQAKLSVQLLASTSFVPGAEDVMGREGYEVRWTNADADELGEFAGRLCYKAYSRPNPATATNSTYLGHIQEVKHFSILEHATATFLIKGVSRSLTHELVRHRHLSYSQVSQRYVDESDGDYVVHPALEKHLDDYTAEASFDDRFFDNTIGEMYDYYNRETRRVYTELVEYLVKKKGYSRKTARGAARGFLPNFTETQLVVTGNHRAWRDVINLRKGPGADEEIFDFANQLLHHLKGIAPNTYQDLERTDLG